MKDNEYMPQNDEMFYEQDETFGEQETAMNNDPQSTELADEIDPDGDVLDASIEADDIVDDDFAQDADEQDDPLPLLDEDVEQDAMEAQEEETGEPFAYESEQAVEEEILDLPVEEDVEEAQEGAFDEDAVLQESANDGGEELSLQQETNDGEEELSLQESANDDLPLSDEAQQDLAEEQEDMTFLDLSEEQAPAATQEEASPEIEEEASPEIVTEEAQENAEQTGAEEEAQEESVEDEQALVAPIAPKRTPKPRNFRAVNTDKPFRLWSVLTGWLLFFANILLLYALVGSATGNGNAFAQVGVLPLTPFSYTYVIAFVHTVQADLDILFIVNNAVPLLAILSYAITVLVTLFSLFWSFARTIGVCTRADILVRRARWSRLYRGVMRCYALALVPLALAKLWGGALTGMGTLVLVITLVLYLLYAWLYSWFFNADNEANRPDVFEFWAGGARRTLALFALGLTVYCFANNWLESLFATWRSALTFVSDGGVWTLVAYYLDLLRPLWLAFLLLVLVRQLRRLIRAYGGDFVAEGRKADKLEYREEKTIYKIDSGLARALFYMAVAIIAEGVQAYGFLGLTKGALVTYVLYRWMAPVCGLLGTVVLLASGRKEKQHLKKHKKKKRGSSSGGGGKRQVPVENEPQAIGGGKRQLVIDENEEE